MKIFTNNEYNLHMHCLLITNKVFETILDELDKCKKRKFVNWSEDDYKKYEIKLCEHIREELKKIKKNDKIVYDVYLNLYNDKIVEVYKTLIRNEMDLEKEP